MTSLRARLTVSLLLGLGAVALLFGAALYQLARQTFTEQFDYALLAKARALTSFSEPGRTGVNLQFTEGELKEFEGGAGAEYFQVSVGGTNLLSKSASLGPDDLAAPANLPDTGLWTKRLGNGALVRAVALKFAGTEESDLVVVFARELEPLLSRLRTLKLLISASGLALLATILLVVRYSISYGLKPVRALSEEIQEAKFSTRLSEASAPVELRVMVGELNSLLSRLSEVFEREKRFTADAAHELATPIAELRSLTDVALKWPDEAEATEQVARKANEIARQMEATTRALLALARSELGQAKLRSEQVRLDAMLEEILSSARAKIEAKALRVSSRLDEATAQTDPFLARTILFNLVDNAIEHSPAGAAIDVALSRDETGISLSLANDQRGLTEADIGRVTQPFWRKDLARTDSTHAGLGLALVKAHAAQLALSLRFSLTDDDRFHVALIFPRQGA